MEPLLHGIIWSKIIDCYLTSWSSVSNRVVCKRYVQLQILLFTLKMQATCYKTHKRIKLIHGNSVPSKELQLTTLPIRNKWEKYVIKNVIRNFHEQKRNSMENLKTQRHIWHLRKGKLCLTIGRSYFSISFI